MTDETAAALDRLNRRFYEAHGVDFSGTRTAPWQGWERCLPYLAPATEGPVRILDAGCGNGRLARFLLEHRQPAPDYVGLDASRTLIEEARRSVRAASARFVKGRLPEDADTGPFDAVALFGVLHHVPGAERRAALVAELARRLAAGGHLVATIWRADGFARFRDRFVPWSECERRTGIAIDPSDLDSGDALLPWKHDATALRYCHFPDHAEIRAWCDASGLPVRESFEADGREGELNRYLVLGPAGP